MPFRKPHTPLASLCAPQDEKILQSPVKVKKFLEAHNIAYDPATPERVLKGKAKARMKMIAEEGISSDEKRRKFAGKSSSLSVKALKEIAQKMASDDETAKAFYRVEFTIDELSSTDVVQLKHEVGWPVNCAGFVRNNKCLKCGLDTPGIPSYSFRAILADLEDDKCTIVVNGKDGAGTSMFGMTADAFYLSTSAVKKEKIEAVLCAPASAQVSMQYTKGGPGDPLISVYDYLLTVD